MKEQLKVFCAENESGRIIEMEPNPDDHSYYNVSTIKGVDGPNKSLRTNKTEELLFANEGDCITIKQVKEEDYGLRNTGIRIVTGPGKNVTIEDYIAIKKNGLIIANSLGVIEIFTFDIYKRKYKKISQLNLNRGVKASKQFQQVTTMAVTEDESMLAVATCIEDEQDVKLKNLLIFKIENKGNLTLLDARDFDRYPGHSMYFYLNFEYTYLGLPVLFAFQAEGQKRADIYVFDKGQVDLVCSHRGYHSCDFSAIRALNGKIVSIDYDGVMRILDVPE